MPEIAVMFTSKTTGHDSCAPVPAITGNPLVTINGKPVVCIGDQFAPHGCDDHGTHQDVVVEGSGIMTVGGRPVARKGDKVEGGETSSIANGESLVMTD